jgi:GTA TIM-barrel-like domain/Putative phage tail protein
MATVVLQYAGAAIGTALGGPIGGIIGRAVGAIAGSVIDQQLFSTSTHREGPRLSNVSVMASVEGAPIPVVYGRMRIAGQVIWASNFEEIASTSTQKSSGKGGPGPTVTDYNYFANFAVGLCEGEIDRIGRVWADGKEIDFTSYTTRLYRGTETQLPDSLITTIQGPSPAYRGLAYVVFERLALAKFGNRIPQLAFEVFRNGNGVASQIKAVNIIPGATEFGYDTTLVTRSSAPGITATENAHASAERSDWSVSMDQLQSTCANLDAVALVVSWFGTDLRCGTCQIKPGVEQQVKSTSPISWQVSGTARAAAYQVSQSSGGAAYGGTPSDASVIRAIKDVKARGKKIVFYPFILMDIPAGNALPDPYGGTTQSNYPWRGRMTASIAPGRAGTPDKTAAAATQVASFVGTALPSHFALGTDAIMYSGPAEWSYRRMILHYAKLCAAAGGVDAFLVGSELVGLTTLRSASGTYPFVAALQNLASEVKAILPAAKISYAADWSEYFGHHPNDASLDHYFHLDPLWSSPSIDFVGIDNYLPLSDWRDGQNHLDYLAGTKLIYDQTYLQARIASGENYDWYYASQNDRDAQIRTNIVDGAYVKPWVFRAKDFKNWWANAHYNRPAGIESATPTSWVPQSKPIWFTETGCPAIDKGTNAPNSFYDAKSAESTLPPYSTGSQDQQMQQAFVRAVQTYWNGPAAQNPISNIYGARMVDPARIFYWTWDARPFPAFPARSDVWSDAANYERGHWLNGRLSGVDLGDLIVALAARFGFSDIDVTGVVGAIDGFLLDRPLSARDALEGLLQSFAIDAIESNGRLIFKSRITAQEQIITADDFVEEKEGAPLLLQTRAQETDLPAAVRLGYVDSSLDYRSASVTQKHVGSGSSREINVTIAAAISQSQAQARVDVALEEAWAARESAQFILPPHFAKIEVGDVVKYGANRWHISAIADGAARKIEATAFDTSVYDAPPSPQRNSAYASPAVYGVADSVAMDLATAKGSTALWLAAQATPWPASLALYKKTGTSSFTFNRLISQAATLASTVTALPSGLLDRLDFNQALTVQMRSGALASISLDEILNGGNLAAVGTASTGYEIIQYQFAELTATNTYTLRGLLRGLAGSSPEMLNSRPAGQDFILLNAAVIQPELSLAESSLTTTWRLGPSIYDHGHPSYVQFDFTGALKSLRPLAPSFLKSKTDATGVTMSWIRQTRSDGDSWDLIDVPLAEVTELYKVDILNGAALLRSITTATPNCLYTSADLTTDFGAIPLNFTVRIAQISAVTGAGATLERIINV